MSRSSAFDPVLSIKASSFLFSLTKARQKQVLRLLFQLAEHPTQLGDYATRDDRGREIQHLMVGDWHFSFWADHAVHEFRIIEIDEL